MLIAGGAPAVAIDPDAETIARVVLMHAPGLSETT
jgi:hypothetical protein